MPAFAVSVCGICGVPLIDGASSALIGIGVTAAVSGLSAVDVPPGEVALTRTPSVLPMSALDGV